MRRPRTCSQARTREALGFRPGPLRGSAASAAGRGQACGAKPPRVATSPEERTRVLRRRGGAPGGVAVCLCLPAIREIRRGLLHMRLSALRLPLTVEEEEKDKSSPRAAARERERVAV